MKSSSRFIAAHLPTTVIAILRNVFMMVAEDAGSDFLNINKTKTTKFSFGFINFDLFFVGFIHTVYFGKV